MKVYHVICKVDNGISITNWSSLVCALNRDHAAELILGHWNS